MLSLISTCVTDSPFLLTLESKNDNRSCSGEAFPSSSANFLYWRTPSSCSRMALAVCVSLLYCVPGRSMGIYNNPFNNTIKWCKSIANSSWFFCLAIEENPKRTPSIEIGIILYNYMLHYNLCLSNGEPNSNFWK